MCAHMLHATFGRPLSLHDPASIVVFEDHTSYVAAKPGSCARRPGAQRRLRCAAPSASSCPSTACARIARSPRKKPPSDDGSNVAGISHAMVAEHYALPGQVVVGTDSHTPHSGALGCVAFGVGTTDMANAFVTGAVRITVPQTLRVQLDGRAASRRDGQGRGAAPAGPAGHPGRRGRRQGVRVRRAGGARACNRRAGDPDQHDGRARWLHRYRGARRGDSALSQGAPQCRLRSAAVDAQRRGGGIRRRDPGRLQLAHADGVPTR